MKSKKKIIQPLQTCIYIILILLAVVYIAPMLWVLLVSLKTNAEVMGSPFSLPEIYQWGNYTFAWENARMGRAFLNSVLVSGITMIVGMLLGSMVAFAIARMRWKFSGLTLIYFLSGMMIPVHCVLIPLFVRFSKLGLTNSLTGLLLPYITFSLPTAVFLLTNFFKGMPSELMEAAFIDGCSIYKCFFRIALPLAKTGIMVAGLMNFVGNWNELLIALVFVTEDAKKTLPVTLTYFVSPYATNYVQMFAGIMIAILPTILVYCLFSNQIVDGLTAGAVKG